MKNLIKTVSAAASVTASKAALVQITLIGNSITDTQDNLNADLTGDNINDANISGFNDNSIIFGYNVNGVARTSQRAAGVNVAGNLGARASFSLQRYRLDFTSYGSRYTSQTRGTRRSLNVVTAGEDNLFTTTGTNFNGAIFSYQAPGPADIPSILPGGTLIQFSDVTLFAGQPINAFLEIIPELRGSNSNLPRVSLTRLIFDDGTGDGSVDFLQESLDLEEQFPVFGTVEDGVFTRGPAFVPEPSSLALLALGAGGITARRKRKKAE